MELKKTAEVLEPDPCILGIRWRQLGSATPGPLGKPFLLSGFSHWAV